MSDTLFFVIMFIAASAIYGMVLIALINLVRGGD